jgi:hypothetical protein
MHSSPHRAILSRFARRAILSLCGSLCAAGLSALTANTAAQSQPQPFSSSPTISGTIRVNPEIGLPTQERTITFSGVWRDGCPPVLTGIVEEPVASPKTITLQLSTPLTLVACTQALTPYEVSTKYTPKGTGGLAVIATIDQQSVALGSLIIADLRPPTPNLSGTWINWTKVGSILNLTQSTASEGIVGNLGTFDANGNSKWLLIHSSRRLSDNTYEARFSDYTAALAPHVLCPPDTPLSVCPGYQINGERTSGIVRITVYSKDVITIEVRMVAKDSPSAAGTLLLIESYSRHNF